MTRLTIFARAALAGGCWAAGVLVVWVLSGGEGFGGGYDVATTAFVVGTAERWRSLTWSEEVRTIAEEMRDELRAARGA